MLKSKFARVFIICICLLMLSSGAALAKSGGGSSPAVSAPDAATQSEPFQKQKEIDEYIFEQHRDEIAQKGFTVTNTGVVNGYVEIGISPYSEDNANYLYEIFGRDEVKVVEGMQYYAMDISTNSAQSDENVAQAASVSTTSAEKAEDAESSRKIPNTLLYSVIGVGAIGAALLVIKKTARR